MLQPGTIPATFDQPYRPSNNRKRSSTDVADLDENPSGSSKRNRNDLNSQPHFEHQTSFNSSFGAASATQPGSTDDLHDLHDDSGIGLGIMDEPFSLPTSAKEHASHPQSMSNGLDVLHASLSQGHASWWYFLASLTTMDAFMTIDEEMIGLWDVGRLGSDG
jgi:hypothetical protein